MLKIPKSWVVLRSDQYWHELLQSSVLKAYLFSQILYLGNLFSWDSLGYVWCHLGQAIVAAVTSGSKKFFLGTDSAPHEKRRKECPCGCAGIYNAPVALSLYAKVFEEVLSHLSDVDRSTHVLCVPLEWCFVCDVDAAKNILIDIWPLIIFFQSYYSLWQKKEEEYLVLLLLYDDL